MGDDRQMAELWVKGLRSLIGHSDEDSDNMAREAKWAKVLHDAEAAPTAVQKASKEHKKRIKSLVSLQKDLFVMTSTTVFSDLEEERIWDIDESVRERFGAKPMYELS